MAPFLSLPQVRAEGRPQYLAPLGIAYPERSQGRVHEGSVTPTPYTSTTYCPVPVTFMLWVPGFAASLTVTALARVPTPLGVGVKVTVNVHVALLASDAPHGVRPPGTAASSPLPAIVGLTELARLLVSVTVCGVLEFATGLRRESQAGGRERQGKACRPLHIQYLLSHRGVIRNHDCAGHAAAGSKRRRKRDAHGATRRGVQLKAGGTWFCSATDRRKISAGCD
jgi:hypothetical protein